MLTGRSGSGRWIRGYRRVPGGVPLFCFPHAGGAASYFHPWSASLAPGIEVLAVQYPGREDRAGSIPAGTWFAAARIRLALPAAPAGTIVSIRCNVAASSRPVPGAPAQEKGAMAGDELDRPLILPLIKRVAPEDPGSEFVFPEADEPVVEETAGGLLVFYVFDLPGMFRYVSAGDCARLQLAPGDLRSLAVANLTRRRARPQIKQGTAAAMFVLDGDLEASLLLVDHLWEQIGPQLPAT